MTTTVANARPPVPPSPMTSALRADDGWGCPNDRTRHLVHHAGHAGLKTGFFDGLDEHFWFDKSQTIAHIRSLVIVGDLGRYHSINAHESLTHRQGTSSSRHPLDVKHHGLCGKAQFLVRHRDFRVATAGSSEDGEGKHRDNGRTPHRKSNYGHAPSPGLRLVPFQLKTPTHEGALVASERMLQCTLKRVEFCDTSASPIEGRFAG